MRFGLFGTGHWATVTHGRALAVHPGVEVVGVWGRDPAKAATLAATLGARPFTDADDLIAAVDAVAIALPPAVQADLAVRAARAGRHLLLDKPLALDVAAADEVMAEVSRAGVASVVFFTGRFTAAVNAFMDSHIGRSWDGAHAMMWGSIYRPGSPYAGSAWRRAHGGLWDVGPHALSVVLPLLGPVRDVAAMTGPRATTQVLLHHYSGAVSHLTLTLDAPPASARFHTELYGPEGIVTVPSYDEAPDVAFRTAIDQLLATVSAGRTDHPCGVGFARDVVAVLAAADRDATTRSPLETAAAGLDPAVAVPVASVVGPRAVTPDAAARATL